MTMPHNIVYLVLELRLRGGELRGGGRDGEHGDGICDDDDDDAR